MAFPPLNHIAEEEDTEDEEEESRATQGQIYGNRLEAESESMFFTYLSKQ